MRVLAADTRGLMGTRTRGRIPPAAVGITALGRRNVLQRMIEDVGLIGINVNATMNNTPVPIDRIDLSNIPSLTMDALQQITEEEGPIIVDDARRLLDQRIIYPERSTGFLSSTIGWRPTLPGVTVEATAPYAFWVEEGQRSFSGHHFLHDATELARPRISNKIVSRLNRLIRDGRVS